jgi:hypothetical protein
MTAVEDTAAEGKAEQEVTVHINIRSTKEVIGLRSTAIADSYNLGCTRSRNP